VITAKDAANILRGVIKLYIPDSDQQVATEEDEMEGRASE